MSPQSLYIGVLLKNGQNDQNAKISTTCCVRAITQSLVSEPRLGPLRPRIYVVHLAIEIIAKRGWDYSDIRKLLKCNYMQVKRSSIKKVEKETHGLHHEIENMISCAKMGSPPSLRLLQLLINPSLEADRVKPHFHSLSAASSTTTITIPLFFSPLE